MPEVGDIVTVILWHGEQKRDAVTALDYYHAGTPAAIPVALADSPGNLRAERVKGHWFVVADAVRYQP